MWPEEGDFPENVHRVVYVMINKRSVESFMCSDLISYTISTFYLPVPYSQKNILREKDAAACNTVFNMTQPLFDCEHARRPFLYTVANVVMHTLPPFAILDLQHHFKITGSAEDYPQ